MELMEEILKEIEKLDEAGKRSVLDFARRLRADEEAELDAIMDSIIDENYEALQELAK